MNTLTSWTTSKASALSMAKSAVSSSLESKMAIPNLQRALYSSSSVTWRARSEPLNL